MVFLIIILLVVLLVGWYFSAYNGLIKLRNWTDESFSQIDVQLQRRNDLIPNLVNTVKGYAQHEKQTLEAVVQARQQLVNLPADATPEQINQLSNELSGTLSRLLAVSEAYPDLKANTNFVKLQEELVSTENKIAYARQLYNSTITKYNIKVQTVPTNIVANIGGFTVKQLLETPQEDRAVPTVEF